MQNAKFKMQTPHVSGIGVNSATKATPVLQTVRVCILHFAF